METQIVVMVKNALQVFVQSPPNICYIIRITLDKRPGTPYTTNRC